MVLDVQRGVPIPKAKRHRGPTRLKYPFESLEVGDFFFVAGKTHNTLATYVSTIGKQLGRRFSTRLTAMHETLEGWQPCDPSHEGAVTGVGVWRKE